MNHSILLTLDPSSLVPFQAAWQKATAAARKSDGKAVLAAARNHWEALQGGEGLPGYVRDRLDQIPELLELLSDPAWEMPAKAHDELLGALAYFGDEADLIPDRQSGYGLLDDALILDLALQTHHAEWAAWRDFNRARIRLGGKWPEIELDRGGWLALLETKHRYASYSAHTGTEWSGGLALSLLGERPSYIADDLGPQRFSIH